MSDCKEHEMTGEIHCMERECMESYDSDYLKDLESKVAELEDSRQKWKHQAIRSGSLEKKTVAYVELKNKMEKQNSDLKAKVAGLEKENSELKGTMDDLEEDVTRLGLVNTALTGVIDRIRGGKR